MKKLWVFIVFCTAVLGSFLFFQKTPVVTEEVAKPSAEEKKLNPQQIPPEVKKEQKNIQSVKVVSEKKDQDFENKFPEIPSPEDIKASAVNPHETPAEYTKFASSVGALMDEARNDPEKRSVIFKKLSECALELETSETKAIRAFCADAAKILSEEHPDQFQKDWYDLKKKLPHDMDAMLAPLESK